MTYSMNCFATTMYVYWAICERNAQSIYSLIWICMMYMNNCTRNDLKIIENLNALSEVPNIKLFRCKELYGVVSSLP